METLGGEAFDGVLALDPVSLALIPFPILWLSSPSQSPRTSYGVDHRHLGLTQIISFAVRLHTYAIEHESGATQAAENNSTCQSAAKRPLPAAQSDRTSRSSAGS